jgi:hypothetical protein
MLSQGENRLWRAAGAVRADIEHHIAYLQERLHKSNSPAKTACPEEEPQTQNRPGEQKQEPSM